MKSNNHKKRSSSCYEKKVRKIRKWYEHLMKERSKEVKPGERVPIRKELKPVEVYIDQIKKPTGESK